MGRSGDTEKENWGTWEELLLACAVTRHGTSSWDSVAMEVQSRSPFSHLLTPNKCRLRYLHLNSRFSSAASASAGESGTVGDPESSDAGAWVDELRMLRVAELRREVERCDLSIVSLELKVNRLKEERERGPKEDDPCGEDKKQDLTVEDHKDDIRSPGSIGAEISGRSCNESNESNSTDLKEDEKAKPGDESGTGLETGTNRTAGEVGKPGGESGEYVAESKESSDVQSSASLSTRRRKAVSSGEAEGGPALSPSPAESQPLIAFLETIRSDKFGSTFERRLESQQSEKYQSTIKQHVDLEMIRTKLQFLSSSDSYTSATEFYRDLLLLCANALVFYPKSYQQHAAALHLRSLVLKQINSTDPLKPHGSSSSSLKEVNLMDLPKPKADSDVGGPLLEKPAIIVCRKRSSLAKAASSTVVNSANSVVKEEKQEKGPVLDPDSNLRKTSTRGPRTSKTRSNTTLRALTSNPDIASRVKSQKQSSDKGSDKSVAASANLPKKRNAVDFLHRLKDHSASTSSKVSHGETCKKAKTEAKREQGSSKKQTTPPGKRSVGRPPKRPASSVTPPPSKRLKEEPAKLPPTAKRRGGRRS